MKRICTLRTILARSLEHCPDKLAVVEGDRRFTFRQLSARIYRIGNTLAGLGLARGDRVAVLSRNSCESAELYIGAPIAGFVVVLLNYRLSLAEIVTVLDDSGAAVLIISDEYRSYLECLQDCCRSVKHFICIRRGDISVAGMHDYETLIADAEEHVSEVEVMEDDLAALMYTSGTTGVPKGCMVSHRNLYHVGRSMALELRMGPDDTGIIPVPMFHASGVVVLLNGVYSGNTSVILPRWHVLEFLRLVAEYQVTTGLLATPMVEALANCRDCRLENLTSLKKVIFAGAPLSSVVFEQVVHRFGNVFIHGFGTTETLGSISILRLEQVEKALTAGNTGILGSCGKSYADMKAEVVGSDGRRVAAGVVGEIRASGLGVVQGYWQKERETEKAFRDGWYYTEDLARVDDRGFIYIVGRKRDMIITGGENVFPVEVENILHKHPAVAQAAVIGRADDVWGESITAVIVTREGMAVSESELKNFCREQIAGYKVPKHIVFTDELPTSATGKLMKGKLREKIGIQAMAESLADGYPSSRLDIC